MRAFVVLTLACGCMLSTTPILAQQFPYAVQLPAQTPYYGTAEISGVPAGQLPAGTTVEVHRRDGPWLAIRPPAESFSWVSARDVEPTNQPNVVRVRTNGVISWIGHAGRQTRTIWQVELNQGELLQVQADALTGDEQQVQQWYKIAPPAGEFRFVHERHVSAQAFEEKPPKPKPESNVQLQAGWSLRNASSPTQATPAGSTTAAQHPVVQANVTQAASNVVVAMPTGYSSPSIASTPDAVQTRLNEIDQQLAAMLAYPPNRWNPSVVVPDLQRFMATASTAEQRQQARTLWQQAIKCQQVQQEYANVAAGIQTSVQPAAAKVPAQFATQGHPAAAHNVAQAMMTTNAPGQFTQPPINPYQVAAAAPPSQAALGVSPEFRALAPKNLLSRVRQAAYSVSEAVQPDGSVANYGRGGSEASAAQPQLLDWPVDENGYAGKGWLMPLVQRSQMPLESRIGVPPLALTDDEGNVKMLVTPAAGSNMREYLRKEVAVIGPVSKLPDIATPHVSAQRVVVLERHQ